MTEEEKRAVLQMNKLMKNWDEVMVLVRKANESLDELLKMRKEEEVLGGD